MAVLSTIIGAVLNAARSGKANAEQTAGNVFQPQLKMDSSDIKNATNYAKITDLEDEL